MIEANMLLVQRMAELGMDYPIHLGVTEAGRGDAGRVKSTLGTGPLLMAGIGDTIRVSLTEPPINELSVAYEILQTTGRRMTKAEQISCPSCGRTTFNIEALAKEVEQATTHLVGKKFSTMGCVVNGPGEAPKKGYGLVGMATGKVALYRDGEMIRELGTFPVENAVGILTDQLKKDGEWYDPPEKVPTEQLASV
jgi:(E)-4-hydroxy-3-methylbut-2-enyl-diphosphate synthase